MAQKDIQLKAVMGAVDKLSPVLDKQASKVGSLGRRINALDRALSGTAKAGVGVFRAALMPMVPTLAAAGGAAVGSIKSFVEYADALDATAKKTGLTIKSLEQMRYAASVSGASAETMDAAIRKLNETLFDARNGKNDSVKTLLERMGIDPKSTKDIDKLMPKIMEAFRRNQDPQLREKMAMALFGKQGVDLIPLLIGGEAGYDELKKRFADLGLGSSEQAVKAAGELNNSFTEVKASAMTLAGDVTEILAPSMKEAIDDMLKWVGANRQFIAQDIAGTVKGVALAMQSIPWTAVLAGIAGITAVKTLASIVKLCAEVKKLGLALRALSFGGVPGLPAIAAAGAGVLAYQGWKHGGIGPDSSDNAGVDLQAALGDKPKTDAVLQPAAPAVNGTITVTIKDEKSGQVVTKEVPVGEGALPAVGNVGIVRDENTREGL